MGKLTATLELVVMVHPLMQKCSLVNLPAVKNLLACYNNILWGRALAHAEFSTHK